MEIDEIVRRKYIGKNMLVENMLGEKRRFGIECLKVELRMNSLQRDRGEINK